MKRIIHNIEYSHDKVMSKVSIDVTIEGEASTDLTIVATTIGDTSTALVWTPHRAEPDGIEMLMDNEGISMPEALGEVAGLLADMEKAERLNRSARQGLSTLVLGQMTEGTTT